MSTKINTLVLAGAGAYGAAYVGGYRALLERGQNITIFSGVSAGSISSLFFLISEEDLDFLEKISKEFDIRNIINYEVSKYSIKLLWNLLFRGGLLKREGLRNELRKVLKYKYGKEDFTFEELYNKTEKFLEIGVSNLTADEFVILNVERSPALSVVEAVCASSCLLYVFKPYIINGNIIVDGGYFNNFPLSFYPKFSSIGLRIKFFERTTILVPNSLNVFSATKTLIESYSDRTEKQNLEYLKANGYTFLEIDLDDEIYSIGSVNFSKYDNRIKNKLIEYGYVQTKDFLDKVFFS